MSTSLELILAGIHAQTACVITPVRMNCGLTLICNANMHALAIIRGVFGLTATQLDIDKPSKRWLFLHVTAVYIRKSNSVWNERVNYRGYDDF